MLRELLVEAGWTGDALARVVNAAGAEAAMPLRYGRSSVAHWLSGMCPWPPVPELVAEVFSRRLRRPISVSEVGLARQDPGESASVPAPRQADWWETDVVS